MLRAVLALAVMLTSAIPALAHGLGAECKLVGDQVEVEAFYDDDTPARGARIRVLSQQQEEIAQGRTDSQGRWSFPAPPPGFYRVIVDAGAGHRAQRKITIPAASPGDAIADPVPSSPDVPVVVSEGPSREEFTGFPWLKAGLGLLIIGGVGLAWWLSRKRRAVPEGSTRSEGPEAGG